MTSINPRVFFDLSVEGKPLGRIIMELFKDDVPETVENFRALCTGELGVSKKSGQALCYRGSSFHRLIKGFMLQGGDITRGNGSGGESIYGGTFPNENFSRTHDDAGFLSMANRGPDTNTSQFFILFRPTPHLDGKHVVFGRIVKGYAEVIDAIEKIPVDAKDRPTQLITIAHCGELELRRPIPPVSKEEVLVKERSDTRGRSLSRSSRSSSSSSRSKSSSFSRSRSSSRSRSRSFSRSRSRSRSSSRSRSVSRSRSRSRSPVRSRRRSTSRSRHRSTSRPKRRSTSRSRRRSISRSRRGSPPRSRRARSPRSRRNRPEQRQDHRRQAPTSYRDATGRWVKDESGAPRDRPRQRDGAQRYWGGQEDVPTSEVKYKGRGSMRYMGSGRIARY